MAKNICPSPPRAHAKEVERFAARFQHTNTWIFDLDNTLYSAGNVLWRIIDQRMTVFIAAYFGIDGLSAYTMQKHYYQKYGATLCGLVLEHGVCAETFLSFVHDVDRSSLLPDPRLAAGVRALPGRKLVFTNGSRDHALRTMRRLRIDHVFEDIFDVVDANLTPKPYAEAYQLFLKKYNVNPKEAAMFEDSARNLEPAHALGATTILVTTPHTSGELCREPWENAQSDQDQGQGGQDYVDFVTDDLGGFITDLSKKQVAFRS